MTKKLMEILLMLLGIDQGAAAIAKSAINNVEAGLSVNKKQVINKK